MKTIRKIVLLAALICVSMSAFGSTKVFAYTSNSGSWSLNRMYPNFTIEIDLDSPWYSQDEAHNAFNVVYDCTYGKCQIKITGSNGYNYSKTVSSGDSGTIRITNCSKDRTYKVTFSQASAATEGEYQISSYYN